MTEFGNLTGRSPLRGSQVVRRFFGRSKPRRHGTASGRTMRADVAEAGSGQKGEFGWEAKAAFAQTRDWKI